jgi:hypothetical protein
VAIAMTPRLRELGIREVLGIHRTDNDDTIAAARKKGIQSLGTITRTRIFWKVWFDYVDAEDGLPVTQARGASPSATTTSGPGAVVGCTPRP